MKYDKAQHYWFCESDAEIVRYKFVINDILRLNDPNAGRYMEDENWEVWSVAGEGNGIEPKLSYFNISDNMTRGITKAIKKAAYMLQRPLDIYTGVGICHVKGLHSVTYICFQPDGSIYKLEESSIGQFEENESHYVECSKEIVHMETNKKEFMGKILIVSFFVLVIITLIGFFTSMQAGKIGLIQNIMKWGGLAVVSIYLEILMITSIIKLGKNDRKSIMVVII